VTFGLHVTYPGFHESVDNAIESITGFRASSGYDFGNDERDMQFEFATEFEAKRARQRLLEEVPTHPVAISVTEPYEV
jgi:hypothetical protein